VIYRQAFERAGGDRAVCAGIIGTGEFATAIITQSTAVRRLDVRVAADRTADRAVGAFVRAGFSESDIEVCESRDAALRAFERGARVVVTDPLMMMELPVDVIVEATGDAEAGALHAVSAIRHGKHVAMVNKEADTVVGPILKYLAGREGVIYSAVDGDQHGLLIGLVAWAREIGLELLAGGKACDTGIVFDPAGPSLCLGSGTVALDDDAVASFGAIPAGAAARVVDARCAALGESGSIRIHDYEESVIMANATGLVPDVEELHHPVLRTVEIPEVLCPKDEGGILQTRGVVDAVIELRDPLAPGMAGGVFIVVACDSDYSRRFLRRNGLSSNSRGTATLIYRPYHLCGVEATLSIVCAGLLGLSTGAADYKPRFDLFGRASRRMKAGAIVRLEDLAGLMRPARPVGDDSPLPLRLAIGRPLTADVDPGTVLTGAMVVQPAGSSLWSLRAEQDEHFFGRDAGE